MCLENKLILISIIAIVYLYYIYVKDLTVVYVLFKIITLEHIELLTGAETGTLILSQKLRPKIIEQLEDRRLSLNQAHKLINSELMSLTVS